MTTETKRTIRRIVVTFGREGDDRTLLEVTTEIARAGGSELAGLFVEDIDLLRLAGLPFARELSRFAPPRSLSPGEVERQLRIRAERARRALEAVAARADVPWSFRVVRGSLSAELRDEAIIALAMETGLPAPSRGPVTGETVVVPFRGTAASERALEVAAHIARSQRKAVILLVDPATHDPEELRRHFREIVGDDVLLGYRSVSGREIDGVLDTARRLGCAFLVLEATDALEPGALDVLRERARCPVFLVS